MFNNPQKITIMEKINILIVLLVATVFSACEKTDEKPVLDNDNAVAPTLVTPATGDSYDLNTYEPTDSLDMFSWTPADYGVQIGLEYYVEASAEEAFTSAEEVGSSDDLSLSVSIEQMSEILDALEIDTTAIVYFRVSSISGSGNEAVDTLYSNVNNVTMTPIVDTSGGGGDPPAGIGDSIFVARSTDNYDLTKAPTIYIVETEEGLNTDEILQGAGYQAYVTITEDNAGIIFATSRGDNAVFYGSDGAGGLVENGDTIVLGDAGHYFIRTNEAFTEYVVVKKDWGIIGSGTPGGWDADTDMTFDPATGLWSIDIDLTADEIKFRANDEWDPYNYGDGVLDQDNRDDVDPDGVTLTWYGNNIAVSEAGNYTVTIDLTIFPYTYELVKN